MKANRQHGAVTRWALLALTVAALAGIGGYLLGKRQAHAPENVAAMPSDPGAGAVLSDASGRRVLYWHDPMVPGQRFDKPGKSPFMDMQLVPVYADAAADEGSVSVSPRLAQSFGVRTVEARSGSLETGFRANGAVAGDQRTRTGVQ